jgi:Zn-dependent metalloprotease/uncharacterized protein Usg
LLTILKKLRLQDIETAHFCSEREGIFMKMLRIVFIVLTIWTFLIGQAIAAQENNLSDNSTAIKSEHQFLANQLIQQTAGKVRIKTHSKTGNVNYIGVDPANAIRQPSILSAKPTPEEAARGFLAVYGPLLGLKDQSKDLKVVRTKTSEQGRSSIRFQQVHSSVPIFGGESIVQVDSSKNIISVHSKILSDIDINTTPATSAEVAEKAGKEIFIRAYQSKYTFDVSTLLVSKPELWIYNPFLLGRGKNVTYLVWRMEMTPQEMLPIRELVLVDAMFGDVVLHFNQIDAALNRLIYDHNNISGKPLPGNPSDFRRSEGEGPSGIIDVDKAYDYAGDTYNFYLNYHGRDSINNAGMDLISTTRYCPGYPYPCPYPNAFWDGTQMVYGQGFASADDVVAHEMTHGVTDYESNLIYLGQSGAINEAFSDIWGEFVDLTNGKGNDAPTVKWLMGEDLSIGAIRSMKNPPTYGDPDRIWSTYYYCGECDNGGVHGNSGVGNKAAYLMTDGGTFNGITATGLGIAKVAKIFYEAQTNLLISSSDYEDLANALYQACWNFVGTDGITTLDCNQVANAINATEMNHQAPENLDQNPGFESGRDDSWTEYSSGGYAIITNNSSYYYAPCGDWYAWLGGYDNAVDYIYQDILVPSNATHASLQFLYRIATYESGGVYDRMFVEIRRPSDNFLLKTLLTVSNANAGNWRRTVQYDLLAYKGQTIRIRFYATNDYSYPTDFLVDDVVVKVGARNRPAVTSFKMNSGAASTVTRTVTLNNAATGSPTHYMASEDSTFAGVSWQPYATAPGFTLSTGATTKTVYFKVKNAFNESLVMNDTISALAPEVTSFKINAGAASTASGVVTLNNVATNSPTHYIASEDPWFVGAIWQTYSTAPKFTLSAGAETKMVCFKVRNDFAESFFMNDEISALPPAVTSFKISAGALSTSNNAAVTLNNTATNLPTHYMASELPTFVGAIWQKYSTAPSFALSSGSGTKIVYFKVKNVFAESAMVSDDISALAPVGTSFKINAGAASTVNGLVTLNNTAINLPTHYMASENPGFAGATWQTYSAAPKFPLSDTAGTKTVYFKVKNAFAESGSMSDDISAAGSAPVVTSFRISNGAASTAKQTVILNNTATNLPMQYMASESDTFAGASWQAYSAAPSFTLSVGSGAKMVYFKLRNIFGESGVMNDTISALAPAVTSFRINLGAVSTANGLVTLNNVATNLPTHYMASEASDFAGATWQTYSTAPKFPLSDTAGTKTVYFKVKNGFDESAMVSDDISAAGSPPVVTSFRINAGAASTANALVTLNNAGTNSPMYYIASESPTFVGATWQPYSTAPKIALSAGSGTKTVYFKTMNIFGESVIWNDTISALAPAVTSFKINAGAASTVNGLLTLNNVAINLPTHYMASEGPGFAGATWQTYSKVPKFPLSDTAGTKTVYIKVKNGFDESAGVNDTIVANGLPPVVTSFRINAGGASTANALVTLNNTGTNSPMYYMASESPTFLGAAWQTYSTAPKITLSAGSGTKTVYFKTMNIFGESYLVSDTIFLY